VDALANATVNIVPSTRYYIAAHRPGVGTAIDATVASKHAAAIDFTENPGMFGAIITHETNGEFSVTYTSQADFTRAVEIASEPSTASATESSAASSTEVDPRDIELAQLRQQV